MSIADELTKLEALRRSGALSDTEFGRAKEAVLSGGAAPRGDAVDALRDEAELARIDREWQIERENYLVTGRNGWGRHVPTTWEGLLTAVVGGAFGLFWTVMAVGITSGAPDEGPFAVAKVFFPLFGVVFVVGAIGYGVFVCARARQYEAAHEQYRARRARAGGSSG